MYILFFLVHVFFAALSYSSGSISVSILFLVGGLVSFFWFSPFRFFRKNPSEITTEVLSGANGVTRSLQNGLIIFFKHSVLGVSLFLFHIALFLGIYSMPAGIGFSVTECIFFGSGIFSLCLIVSKQQKIEKIFHFIFINHALYTFFLVCACLIVFNNITFYLNFAFCLVSMAWIYFAWNPFDTTTKKEIYTSIFLGILFFLLYVGRGIFLFFPESLIFSFIIAISLLSIIFFEVTTLHGFQKVRSIVRTFSLFLSYFSLIFLGYYSIAGYLLSIPVLLIQLFFQIYVHRKYENYPSLLFSSIVPIFVYLFFFSPPHTFLAAIFHALCIFLLLTFLGRIVRTGYQYDEYVFQTVATGAILVLLGGYLVRFSNGTLPEISGILLLFSLSFFISYFQIRK